MKNKIVLYTVIALSFTYTACDNQKEEKKLSTDIIQNGASASEGKEADKEVPEFEFVEDVYDFGEISQGEKVVKQFSFRNIGSSDLIISTAKGSCGCTVPEYPTHPIAPGEEGTIEVVFDSNGKKGRVHNTVTLVANTVPNTKVLAIRGNVLTPNN